VDPKERIRALKAARTQRKAVARTKGAHVADEDFEKILKALERCQQRKHVLWPIRNPYEQDGSVSITADMDEEDYEYSEDDEYRSFCQGYRDRVTELFGDSEIATKLEDGLDCFDLKITWKQ